MATVTMVPTEEFEEYTDEEEVTDTEDAAANIPAIQQPPIVRTPKKVKPTAAVQGMTHHSPANPPQTNPGNKLNPMKNPFPQHGDWTPETFAEVNIITPTLTPMCESTNELTQKNRPEARYWKAPIKFTYSTFSSDTIRISNVHIPFGDGRGYGGSYVYVCLPAFMADVFATAGKTKRPTVVNETSLVPDTHRWWKIANNVSESFGVIDKSTNLFHAKNLEVIFKGSGRGITCSVVGRFLMKASTLDKAPLTQTVPQRVVFEIDRAYIGGLDVDVQGPTKMPKDNAKVAPKALPADVATDDVMKRLASLGM